MNRQSLWFINNTWIHSEENLTSEVIPESPQDKGGGGGKIVFKKPQKRTSSESSEGRSGGLYTSSSKRKSTDDVTRTRTSSTKGVKNLSSKKGVKNSSLLSFDDDDNEIWINAIIQK